MLSFVSSCKDQGDVVLLSPDAELFRHVTQADPFTSYRLFPGVDSVTSGSLNGSTAHQPLVRVSVNETAYLALRADTLPAGSQFPNGSAIFKQIFENGRTMLYAVILKKNNHELSGNGWLWAEFYPDGTPFISVTRRGVNCTSCHAREQGPQHDFVRTFERQR